MMLREHELDHPLLHTELAELLRCRFPAQELSRAAIIPARARGIFGSELDQREQRPTAGFVHLGEVYNARRFADASAQINPLRGLQAHLSRRLEALPLLRTRRAALATGPAGAPLHGQEGPR